MGKTLIEDKYRKSMQDIGQTLDQTLNGLVRPRKTGFVLLVFDFGSGKRINYISNGRNNDMVAVMKEFIARFEDVKEST